MKRAGLLIGKKNLFLFLFASLILICSTPEFISAQNLSKNDVKIWADAGLGLSGAGAGPATSFGGGLSARAAAHIQYRRMTISVPVSANTGGKSQYDALLWGKMKDEYFDVSLMAGYSVFRSKKKEFIVSTGLAATWGKQVRETTEDCFIFCNGAKLEPFGRRLGIPVELGLYSNGKGVSGLSIVTHVNFNPQNTFVGITLNATIGKRR